MQNHTRYLRLPVSISHIVQSQHNSTDRAKPAYAILNISYPRRSVMIVFSGLKFCFGRDAGRVLQVSGLERR